MSFVHAPNFGGLNFLKVMALGLVLTVLQGAALPWPGGAAPEPAVILVVYVAWRSEKWLAVLAAFFLGLFRDAAGGGLLGAHQVTLILSALIFHPWRRVIPLEAALPLALCVFALTLGGNLLILVPLLTLSGWPWPNLSPFSAFLVSALTTALSAPPVFWLIQRLTGGPASSRRHG